MTRHREPTRDIRLLDMLWAQAENQVYPLALSRPDAYQRAVTIARAIADRLRTVTTPVQLARAFGSDQALVMSAARVTGTRIDDLDAGTLAGAGFRLRYQEILAGSPLHPAGGESRQR